MSATVDHHRAGPREPLEQLDLSTSFNITPPQLTQADQRAHIKREKTGLILIDIDTRKYIVFAVLTFKLQTHSGPT